MASCVLLKNTSGRSRVNADLVLMGVPFLISEPEGLLKHKKKSYNYCGYIYSVKCCGHFVRIRLSANCILFCSSAKHPALVYFL